jgi:hypothetical protein
VRGSFSSTLLALAFGAGCAGELATNRDGEFKDALLTPGRRRLGAKAQDRLWKDVTVGHWRSQVFWATMRQ